MSRIPARPDLPPPAPRRTRGWAAVPAPLVALGLVVLLLAWPSANSPGPRAGSATDVRVTRDDSRDVVTGTDPRDGNSGERADDFDVHLPCHWAPERTFARRYRSPRPGDPCLAKGGYDENIYAARI